MKKPYKKAVMGGTFDRLHDAHKKLISTAMLLAEEIFIGIVSDELGKELFAKKKYGGKIQSYDVRKKNVENYVKGSNSIIEIGPLYDAWGPAPNDSTADLIVVSDETYKSALTINKMRDDNKLNLLDIIVIPWLKDENGELISSTKLREREMTNK